MKKWFKISLLFLWAISFAIQVYFMLTVVEFELGVDTPVFAAYWLIKGFWVFQLVALLVAYTQRRKPWVAFGARPCPHRLV